MAEDEINSQYDEYNFIISILYDLKTKYRKHNKAALSDLMAYAKSKVDKIQAGE